jgi:hypothetical protein
VLIENEKALRRKEYRNKAGIDEFTYLDLFLRVGV